LALSSRSPQGLKPQNFSGALCGPAEAVPLLQNFEPINSAFNYSARAWGAQLFRDGVGHSACGQIALHRFENLAGELRAQLIVGVTREPTTQTLLGLAVGLAAAEVIAQQAFNGFGHQRRRATVAHRPRDARMLAHGSAETEVVSVGQFALMLDLLALEADVGDPVLAAAVGAAGNVELELLIELRQPLLELVDQPAREALGFGNRQLAKFSAGAGDGAAPEGWGFNVQADLAQFARQFAGFGVGHV